MRKPSGWNRTPQATPFMSSLGCWSFFIAPVFQSSTSTAGLLTAPSGLLALISPQQARNAPSRAERQVADPAVIDPLASLVEVELRGVEPPRLLAGPHVPLDDQAHQVGRDEVLAVGRVGHAVDRLRVAGQVELGLAVGQRPEPDLAVIAAGGELGSPSGLTAMPADPALMGGDRAATGFGASHRRPRATRSACRRCRRRGGSGRRARRPARTTQPSWAAKATGLALAGSAFRSQRWTVSSSAPAKTYRPAGSNRQEISGLPCFSSLATWVFSGWAVMVVVSASHAQ